MNKNDYFITGLQTKNEKVILEIYKTIYPNVKRFVLQNSGQEPDAEDVFQKAILQIMARLQVQNIEIKSTFDGYLFTACKNLWRRELNKTKNVVTIDQPIEPDDDINDLAQSILEQERWEFFQEKLELISGNCKQILQRFFKKIPYKIIAKELDYNDENVVRQRVFKCKSKLTEMIKSDNRFNQLKTL
ncbi:sigma-70 family RNA polymerase sigma factor [Olleya sp. YSTF-M6]|uniref:Sigma-70 family RNA polymerase sigma factor n=1 Tax=Olleya sediminilitoris TaxID=2795739 RepID=A0ABS1WJK6_9FLAO|nr:sigma-70 family RNA polymerase sigma factor [Olleya sediminilitoris]MBL7559301.1 sigma-70 family RNA polymerase sigma factor [Olleya sediminilitoris]